MELNEQTINGITLGQTYTDPITGLTGKATYYAVHITGCDRVALQPPFDDEKKKLPLSYTVDAPYLLDEDGNTAWNPSDHDKPEMTQTEEISEARQRGGPPMLADR